ncbi:MAG: hypothetical protein ALECFALPRED_004706 [Alectoria fallacina]|uniref:Uncharacterized protein n=1 Tax=Alectoria fallacina TaxID=1903189 RepID=A0A8H3FTX8_9LECA|nr:MAG: hypothetical protein ALECFALPRED_004706 [Alectoria fallacina]
MNVLDINLDIDEEAQKADLQDFLYCRGPRQTKAKRQGMLIMGRHAAFTGKVARDLRTDRDQQWQSRARLFNYLGTSTIGKPCHLLQVVSASSQYWLYEIITSRLTARVGGRLSPAPNPRSDVR